MKAVCSSRSDAVRRDAIPRSEWLTLAALAASMVVLRAIAFFHHRVDSDETQHLHVAWGWTAGLLQYRDVFDNHAPLFHMLSAPLVAILGERPDVILWMRGAMVPLFFASLVSTFFIARCLYSVRTACWTVAIAAAYPPFFLKSLEYRTDNLWSALWLLAMALLVTRKSTSLAGFVLGCALCTSMKTLPLLFSLAIATLIARFLFDRERSLLPLLRRIAAPAAAFLVAPVILGAYFLVRGAWRPMLYCVFEFNLFATRTRPHAVIGRWLFPAALLLMILFAARIGERLGRDERLRDRWWVGLVVFTYFLTTQAFWPILSQRDYLAVIPLIAMFLVAHGLELEWGSFPVPAAAALTLAFTISLFHYEEMFRDRTRGHIAMMRDVLALTRPGDCVMDLKGETIYRRRPFYYALETIARSAISSRVLTDTIPEAVIDSRCHVAGPDASYFPRRGRAFLSANFIQLGSLRAAGQWIESNGSFSVAVPGRYVMAGRDGLARGTLDGARCDGPVWLHAGTHRFLRSAAGEPVASLWAEAFERGYSPFRLREGSRARR